MDDLKNRIVVRFAAANQALLERIEGIRGWQNSNFLMSVHNQAKQGRPLSPRQLEVVDKIEAKSGKQPIAPSGAISFGTKPYGHERTEVQAVLKALRSTGVAKVYDPKGILSSNQKLQEHIIHELAVDFWGIAEEYAERNADEDDPTRHDQNADGRRRAEVAAQVMEKAKLIVKGDMVTTIPNYREVGKKYLHEYH